MRFTTSILTGVVAFFVTGVVQQANAAVIQLIANGNFETGSFAGWSTFDLAGGTGQWNIDTPGTTTPLSSQSTLPNPLGGNFYAVTDQGGPGTHSLLQLFNVPVNMTAMTLSFEMFANNQAGTTTINPAGLDHTATPNQHARVDILRAAAAPFSTSVADVVSNFFLGSDAGSNPHPFQSYSFNISSLAPGTTYQLRFGEVDNQLFYNMGVDNVSILATTRDGGAIPEPTSLVSWLVLTGCGLVFQRSTRQSQNNATIAK